MQQQAHLNQRHPLIPCAAQLAKADTEEEAEGDDALQQGVQQGPLIT